ncbi:MAG: glycosyltransferase family 9 protein [Bdellovibrionales bacterium]|nr:glycosyltransferase family 9 protein [Bdellovibrionales bacterium]
MTLESDIDTLLVRMDKIGDLVVSLNANEHPALEGQRCLWLVNQGLSWVMNASEPRKNYIEFEKKLRISRFFSLVSQIKKLHLQQAIVFQAPWFIGLALFLARVPIRIGRKSQWHSFFFFNRGIRQKRSLSDRHESQYNWDLISEGLHWNSYPTITFPQMKAPTQPPIENWSLKNKEYCVVHPGMMGSALNWPTDSYKSLIEALREKINVVITGTAADRPWTSPLKSIPDPEKNILWLNEKLSGDELLILLKNARFVIAPSTGVIHLAAALNTPVVGFYSPRIVEKETRWGPLTDKKIIFSPPTNRRNDPACMHLITEENVFNELEKKQLL